MQSDLMNARITLAQAERDGDDLTIVLANLNVQRLEYKALSEYERGIYDYLGQLGKTHDECMIAAHSV